MDVIAASMIALYLVATTALGVALSRRNRSSSDWALGGGGMGVVMIAAGIAGTRIGGVGTYGVAGDVVKSGVWNLWYGVNTFLAMALVGIFYAIPYRRLRLSTVGEIFQKRFGSNRCQALTSLCVQTEYLIINIIEPYLIGKIIQQVTGWPFLVGVAIAGAVIVLYTAAGGLQGGAATNLVHCAVIILGLGAVAVLGQRHLGGWSGVEAGVERALADAGKDSAAWWSFVGAGWGGVLAMFFSATVHTPGASVYVNFASSARDERAVIPAFLLGGAVATVMPLLAGWIGIATLAKYGADAQLASYASITKLATEINPWVGGTALAAVLAAVISSAGPILLSSATMFVRDWLWFTKHYTPEKKLLAYRVTTVVYGAIAAVLAATVSIRSVLELLLLGFAMVVPPAVAVGYVIYWRRTTEAGAFWGILSGYLLGLIWFLCIEWAKKTGLEAPVEPDLLRSVLYRCFAHNGEGIDPSVVTTLVPIVAVPAISMLGARSGAGEAHFYAQLARRDGVSS